MSKSKIAAGRRPRRSTMGRRGRSGKFPVSDVPGFLVKLVGWRRLREARTETKPSYRHD